MPSVGATCRMISRSSVMPANAGIQVMDHVRHTVGKRYPGWGMDPGFHLGDEKPGFPFSRE
jgi:hypothetical protein